MNKKQYSVLISVYHKEDPTFLHMALESVFNQSNKPDEVILVKDGPLTNDIEGVITKFKNNYNQLKVVGLDKNMGLGVALSEGLKYCTNNLIARMDTDDICNHTRFEKQVSFLMRNPNIDLVGSNITEFTSNYLEPVSERKLPENHEDIVKFGKRRNPINHMTVMFRKEAVEAVNGYIPFMGFEDYYLWVRMIMNGSKLYNIQEDLVYARVGNDMLSRRIGLEYIQSEIKLFHTFLKSGFISMLEFYYILPQRIIIRLLPKRIIELVYKKILRR